MQNDEFYWPPTIGQTVKCISVEEKKIVAEGLLTEHSGRKMMLFVDGLLCLECVDCDGGTEMKIQPLNVDNFVKNFSNCAYGALFSHISEIPGIFLFTTMKYVPGISLT